MDAPVTVYLGLGSNLGDRRAALSDALSRLHAAPGLTLTACSSVYETEPWGVADQPAFLNLAAGFATTLPPAALLTACQSVEAKVGRTPTYRWGPRTIDVDILLYGGQAISLDNPDLQIPHPRLRERAFVLAPLAEIAAYVKTPPDGATVGELLEQVSGLAGVKLWSGPPVVGGEPPRFRP